MFLCQCIGIIFNTERNSRRLANCWIVEEGIERMLIGWERGSESMEGPGILAWSARPLSTSLSTIFSPLFVLGLAISSLSPLHCIPHSFVILPRKQIREPSLSRHTFPLSRSDFLCFCVLRFPVRSRTQQSHQHFTVTGRSLWCHAGSKGCWVVTRGQTSLCPASISAAWKHVVKCSFFLSRRVLPLFGESVSCFKKSVLPF